MQCHFCELLILNLKPICEMRDKQPEQTDKLSCYFKRFKLISQHPFLISQETVDSSAFTSPRNSNKCAPISGIYTFVFILPGVVTVT